MSADVNDNLQSPDTVVNTAVDSLRKQTVSFMRDCDQAASNTVTAIVLGSGLGSLADKIESPIVIPYSEIPGFARSTAGGHRGQLLFGRIGGAAVIAMAGRLHRYEGWTNDQVAFPIQVMHALGASRLITSNAAGGVNPKLRVGDIVVIRDHINWLYQREQVGQNGGELTGISGEFPGGKIASLYDPAIASLAMKSACESRFTAVEGTYLATLGPTYETRAEYRMMRRMGVDVVGMSTVGEVLTAVNLGMTVLALSIVSNVADVDHANVTDHSEVLEAGDAAAVKLEAIVRRVICG